MKIRHNVQFVNKRLGFLTEYLKDKTVMHVGACDAPHTREKIESGLWLHGTLTKSCKAIKGFDICKKSIEIANIFGYSNIEYADLFHVDENYFTDYEYILFGETIEHLSNPGEFVHRISMLMNTNQKLIISTPNPFFYKNVLHGLRGFEINHEDHKTHHTFHTITQLLAVNGLSILEKYGASFERKSEGLLSKCVTSCVCRLFPILSEDMIVVAKKVS